MLKSKLLRAALATGLMILFGWSFSVVAAEVGVIAANPLRAVVQTLGPQFDRDTGHKLVASIVGSPAVKRTIDAGEVFDVAITSTPVIDDMVKDGNLFPIPVRLSFMPGWA